MPANTDPFTATPKRRIALRCWQHILAAGMLLGLFAMTIRAALREHSAAGIWATIGLWAVMGVAASMDQHDRTHGYLLPRGHKWQ